MDGRYPYEHPGGRRPQQFDQLSAAQVRAVLGLPEGSSIDEALYRQQQGILNQRDIQIRQILLREQQMQEQHLRALGEQLGEYPDIQRYQHLLLNEQLQRQGGQFLRDQAQVQAAQAHMQAQAQLRYQEELRRQQQHLGFRPDDLAQPTAPAVVQPQIQSPTESNEQIEKQRKRSLSKELDLSDHSKTRSLRDRSDSDAKSKTKKLKSEPAPDGSDASEAEDELEENVGDALKKIALAADMATPQVVRKGTVEQLLAIAAEEEEFEDAALIIVSFNETEWSESAVGDDNDDDHGSVLGLKVPKPMDFYSSPVFKSSLPRLPEEPVYIEEPELIIEAMAEDEEVSNHSVNGDAVVANGETPGKKVSMVLEYPYPVDTWWPSTHGIRKERRQNGETSDEDAFDEGPLSKDANFRFNDKKIKMRLATELEPGILEKLPHCRIHRVRTKRKKNSTAPELVYCWQVTEIYPNDTMVNCSVCGTWRHASCGGHYKPFSARENTKIPFSAICEHCYEEKKILTQFPQAEQRLERQRMEQLRRGLATSAVIRHASFSKHGGTYKWPLGSVSATHIGGHTRSVHARHDKAEKQWTDMAARLGRGYGYRPKERVKGRTKELERLLVSVEDAEGYTDRHNMLLFLLRDTARPIPVGYGQDFKNIFDPEEEVPPPEYGYKFAVEDQETEEMAINGDNEIKQTPTILQACVRQGCERTRRFDSMFCSDACGVATLELDLLRTLQDASDVHPSVLRL